MTASGPEDAISRKLDVLIEGKIEELSSIGLPMEFASGLLEIADRHSSDSERLLMMGSLELLLEARRTTPDENGATVSYLQIMHEGDQQPVMALSPNAKSLMKALLGDAPMPESLEQEDVEALVDRLIARDQQRKQVGRPTPQGFYAALELYAKGLTTEEATSGLAIHSTSFLNNKGNFLKRMRDKGIFEEEFARIVPSYVPQRSVVAETSEASADVPGAQPREVELPAGVRESEPAEAVHDRDAKLGDIAVSQVSEVVMVPEPDEGESAEVADEGQVTEPTSEAVTDETPFEALNAEPEVPVTTVKVPEAEPVSPELLGLEIALRFADLVPLDDDQTSALGDLLSLDANTTVDTNFARSACKAINDALVDNGVKLLQNTLLSKPQIERVQKFLGIGFGPLQKNAIMVTPRSLTEQVIADRDKKGTTESQIIDELYQGIQIVADLLTSGPVVKRPTTEYAIIERSAPVRRPAAPAATVKESPKPAQPVRQPEQAAVTALTSLTKANQVLKELREDKDPRHTDGSLDALDLEQAFGVSASRIRQEFKKLVVSGKLQARNPVINRTRPGGQQTAHYRPAALDVLLPVITELARAEAKQERLDVALGFKSQK